MNTDETIILEQMENGPLDNYIYFIGDAVSKEVAVVDPAWNVDEINNIASKKGYKITHILLTHGHSDHVNGIDKLQIIYDIPVFISKYEPDYYVPNCKNIHKTENHEIIKIGNIEVECILTPGHTPGSQCFKCKNILITGDTLFIDGCGRCDLPGGDPKQMYNTLYKVISDLPDDTIIYSGHNYGNTPFSTLKEQKITNPYLQSSDIEEFLRERM